MIRQKVTVLINPSTILRDDEDTKVYSSTSKLTMAPWTTKQEADSLKLKGIHKILTSLTWPYLVSTHACIRKHLVPHA